MEEKGFIVIYRKLIDWEWYDHIPTKVLFIHLLLKANHTTKLWRGNEIKRGQYLTSLNTLSQETGLSVKQVRASLNNLEKTGEVGKQTTSLNTLLSILNYDNYQSKGTPKDKPRANGGQSEGKRRATTNNVNNDNNVNNEEEKPLTPTGNTFDFDIYLSQLNKLFNRDFKVVNKSVRDKMKATLKTYTKSNVWIAMQNCKNDTHHKESNYKYCTPEFFARQSTLERHGDKLRENNSNTYRLID